MGERMALASKAYDCPKLTEGMSCRYLHPNCNEVADAFTNVHRHRLFAYRIPNGRSSNQRAHNGGRRCV